MLKQSFKTVRKAQHICQLQRQKGLVLFVALIALVVMSLASAALVRSVDSGVLVAGNLAFKQSAILSAETGIAEAYKYIGDNIGNLDTSSSGYFALFNDSKDLKDNSTWGTGNSFLLANDAITGNETRYILQRMCWQSGSPSATPNNCMSGDGNKAPNSQAGQNYATQTVPLGSSESVVYRVTVRVAGPKNTRSYLQAFVY